MRIRYEVAVDMIPLEGEVAEEITQWIASHVPKLGRIVWSSCSVSTEGELLINAATLYGATKWTNQTRLTFEPKVSSIGRLHVHRSASRIWSY